MEFTENIKNSQRESVLGDYNAAVLRNKLLFEKENNNATSEYIYENQKIDAMNIVDKFYKNKDLRVISISKKTKVGMDGLMIEISKLLTTHIDNNFILNMDNIRIITGMSNKKWETDLIKRAPKCFEDKIFHHDRLSKSKLSNLVNGLIIIDEIDTGSGYKQDLYKILELSEILDIDVMKEKNIRLIVVSATIMKELFDLRQWGYELYDHYKMVPPSNYIGHKEFLELDIIQDFDPNFDPIKTIENAEKWIKKDIVDRYKSDFRCHIIREKAGPSLNLIKDACEKHNATTTNNDKVKYMPYNSDDTPFTSTDEKDIFEYIFKEELTTHIILGVKGFFRRANLIQNKWKLKIGATHEYYTKNPDISVHIQGLPGRLTGFWRNELLDENNKLKYKVGPYRTSKDKIRQYLEMYDDPFGKAAYKEYGFLKGNKDLLDPDNWKNLQKIEVENTSGQGIPIKLEILDDQEILDQLLNLLNLKGKIKHNECVKILKVGIENNKIIMTDNNKESSKVVSFSFDKYKFKTIRMCTSIESSVNFRFDGFITNHNNKKPYGQRDKKGKGSGYFSIDLNFIDHNKGDVLIKKGIGFISYEQIPIETNQNITTNSNN
jgi:hypothetical protein